MFQKLRTNNSDSDDDYVSEFQEKVTDTKKPNNSSFLKQEIFHYREQLFKFQEQNLLLSVQNHEYKITTENSLKEKERIQVENYLLTEKIKEREERLSYTKKENLICKTIIGSYFLLKFIEKIKSLIK